MSITPQKAELTVPLSESFALEYSKSSGEGETPWWVISQLAIPPNLAFLRAGLLKTRAWLDTASAELDVCLAIVPGSRLSALELKHASQRFVEYIDKQNWPIDDMRLQPLGRANKEADIPLYGESKSLVHHWVNLFYTVEVDASDSSVDSSGAIEDYDALMAGLSAYVIAAYSSSPAALYRTYCNDWHRLERQPDKPPIGIPGLFSRVAAASHALRRVGLLESHVLFDALRILPRNAPFHEKVRAALTVDSLSEEHRTELRKLELLIESLRPGWQPQSRSGHTSRGTSRPTLGDGFVLLAESSLASVDAKDDEGQQFWLTYAIDEEGDAGTDQSADDESPLGLGMPDDDAEWMPRADRLAGDPLVMMDLDDTQSPLPSVASRPIRSAWAEAQLRRSQFAHRLSIARCSRIECKAILRSTKRLEPDSGDTPSLVAIVITSLATGRSADESKSLEILTGPRAEPPALAYRTDKSCWEMRVLPPAWGDTDITKCERPIERTLLLPDKVGFGEFLKKHGLDLKADLGIKKITTQRRKAIQTWLHEAANDRHLRLSVVENALFARVLEASGGDVAVSQIITGRSHSHGASAVHYSHYSIEHLQFVYETAIADMSGASMPEKLAAAGGPYSAPGQEGGRGIGARRVPTTASLKSLLKRLRKDIRAAWKSGETVMAHNLFTTYTLVGLVLSIGLRAVVDPHLRDMAADGRLITYLDKARTDYHRRVSALPQMTVRQLLAYTSYLQRRIPHVMTDAEGFPISFAFIDPKTGLHEPYRPKHFQALVGEYYDLELYSLRRYFRTAMASDPAVCKEDLDALMGHWWEGVSPHDPLSTYPVQRLVELAEGPVSELLRALDYRVMEPLS